jgi:hypothetical protein
MEKGGMRTMMVMVVLCLSMLKPAVVVALVVALSGGG